MIFSLLWERSSCLVFIQISILCLSPSKLVISNNASEIEVYFFPDSDNGRHASAVRALLTSTKFIRTSFFYFLLCISLHLLHLLLLYDIAKLSFKLISSQFLGCGGLHFCFSSHPPRVVVNMKSLTLLQASKTNLRRVLKRSSYF